VTAIGPAKRSIGDLALLGGPALFATPLHVGRPNIGDRERLFARLSEALDRRVLTNGGPLVQEFEARIAGMLGVRHALAVNNATIGLQIAARAAGMRGEVIVPAFTFVATAGALEWMGMEPVFADIRPGALTIDPAEIDRLVTPRTTGIVGVHVWGIPCDTTALEAAARRHDLAVIYDAAHAFACAHGERMVGGSGQAEVFSFLATKFVNAFAGGAITTDDDALAERVEGLRNFGFEEYDRTVGPGINGKMSEASAAMGLTSLDALPAIVDTNLANAAAYARATEGIPGLTMLTPDRAARCNAQYVAARIDGHVAGIDRDTLHDVLHAEQVLVRRYFHPGVHRLEPYASRPGGPPSLPHTEALGREVLVLPTGTAVGTTEIDAIIDVLRFSIAHAQAIGARRPAATPG